MGIPCEITHSKINHFELYSYVEYTECTSYYIYIILNISLLWLLVPEYQDVQISSISKNQLTSIGHNFLFIIFLDFSFEGLTSTSGYKKVIKHIFHIWLHLMLISNFVLYFQCFWNLTMSCSWAGLEIFEYEQKCIHLDLCQKIRIEFGIV